MLLLVSHAKGANAVNKTHLIWPTGLSLAGKIHWRNTRDQLQLVGPKSLGVALLTAGFVGMVFTIQVSDTTIRHDNNSSHTRTTHCRIEYSPANEDSADRVQLHWLS